MKLVHKYAHLIGDEIDYKGDIINKNNIIKITGILQGSKIKYLGIVDRCLFRKSNSIKNCVIDISFKKPEKKLLPSSLRKIIINIYEYDKKSSMYVVFIFNTIQNKKDFKAFSESKNRELSIFKNIIENFNKKKLVNT